jgi:hypothetical protein
MAPRPRPSEIRRRCVVAPFDAQWAPALTGQMRKFARPLGASPWFDVFCAAEQQRCTKLSAHGKALAIEHGNRLKTIFIVMRVEQSQLLSIRPLRLNNAD